MSKRGHELPAKGAAEYDAFSKWWRRWLAGMSRPGVRKSIKRGYNKRCRRKAKESVRR